MRGSEQRFDGMESGGPRRIPALEGSAYVRRRPAALQGVAVVLQA